jgi:hypothetical protein
VKRNRQSKTSIVRERTELIGFFSYSRERAAFERDSEKLRVCAKRGGRQRLKRAKSVGGGVLCQCWHR